MRTKNKQKEKNKIIRTAWKTEKIEQFPPDL